GERAVEHARVRDEADGRAHLGTSREWHTANAGAAGSGLEQSRENAKESGLPRSVGTEDGQALAAREREAHSVHGAPTAEGTHELIRLHRQMDGPVRFGHAGNVVAPGYSRTPRYLAACRGERCLSASRSSATPISRAARCAAYE